VTTPRFGIFARVFPSAPAAQVARSIARAGYTLAQLNLRAIGLPTIPSVTDWDQIDPDAVAAEFATAGVACWGLSCSYNMAHPDPAVRAAGTAAAVELIRRAPGFGVVAVTLCTGSRNAERMWAFHPDNDTETAWADMRAELDVLIGAALDAGLTLAVEPEPGNIVRDARAAMRLCAELGGDSRAVGVIADAANLVTGHPVSTHHEVLERSFAVLAERIICLHAKDLVPWAETLAGRGVVDYRHVAELYERLGLAAPVVVQDVAPDDAAAALDHLDQRFGRSLVERRAPGGVPSRGP
jgi:sugar phosphate isomerase/epimerase